ncbi:unnamed protein product [Gongylonema pulchrum]|uniref:Uncharacterized protein n=1 Tax=Gongylonema pulchrum TaxID=637853 RepID=A0A3P7N2D0_9BILA|nr:unnamed protein product [Gongylonema pulchrum]
MSVDGAISDALCNCVVGALVDLQLREASTDCDEDIPIDITKVELSDSTHHIVLADFPVSSTFIVYEAPDETVKILCDPAPELFEIIPNTVVIVVGNNSRIHRISQSGVAGDEAVMRKMVELAVGRQKLIADSLIRAKEAYLAKE